MGILGLSKKGISNSLFHSLDVFDNQSILEVLVSLDIPQRFNVFDESFFRLIQDSYNFGESRYF